MVRSAVPLRGDCDTLTRIAEVFYGILEEYKTEALNRIEGDMREAYKSFFMNLK